MTMDLIKSLTLLLKKASLQVSYNSLIIQYSTKTINLKVSSNSEATNMPWTLVFPQLLFIEYITIVNSQFTRMLHYCETYSDHCRTYAVTCNPQQVFARKLV